jgi:hypothetical protein
MYASTHLHINAYCMRRCASIWHLHDVGILLDSQESCTKACTHKYTASHKDPDFLKKWAQLLCLTQNEHIQRSTKNFSVFFHPGLTSFGLAGSFSCMTFVTTMALPAVLNRQFPNSFPPQGLRRKTASGTECTTEMECKGPRKPTFSHA